MSGSFFSIKGLCVSYGGIEAVRNVNLEVPENSIVTLIGANGAGKSTTLNALAGLLRHSGTVHFNGVDLTGMSVEARVDAGISLVPESRELFQAMTVHDNLLLGGYRHRHDRAGMKTQLVEVYRLFPRLREREWQYAGTLSGGERQMLALGRALMSRPRLMMLDEPSLGLAPKIVADIFGIIVKLRKEGVSILLVEQNARAALSVADYGYVLETGSVKMQGTGQELSRNDKVIESYLGLAVD